MTCGGILFIVALFVGAAWLGDQLNSSWPVNVAIAIFILLVAWRIFEFVYQRNEHKRIYRQMDWAIEHPAEFQAARDREEGVTFRRKVAVSERQQASFVRQRIDGVEQWRIYFDLDEREPTQDEMNRASSIVRDLNDELGLPNPPAK
jgi:energy-coupling factor transporter transmembrane protein EcfT